MIAITPAADFDGAPAALQPARSYALRLGARLRDYEITGLVGEGTSSIVYLAWDHSLQRKVAVKEYMPASMASRVGGSPAIVVKSERHVDTFRSGLKSFVNEARLLARFDHPSLVKVYRFWEENGTAYMVMPFYEGPTLKTALAELGHVPNEAELRAWLRPILNALSVMHAAQCYHRDIAPDNILLTPTGPLLLDFGAARRVIGDMTHALTVVLKPGYAPIEQYGDVASMAQGAWTDLYALACVVYYAITGSTPMSSVERLMDDRLEPLTLSAAGRYSPAFLGAIDHALAVRPQDRPQTERQFRDLLDADRPVTRERPPAAVAPVSRPATTPPFLKTEEASCITVPGTLTPMLATQAPPPPPMPMPRGEPIAPQRKTPAPAGSASTPAADAPPAPVATAAPHRSRTRWVMVALVLLLLGVGVAAVLWKPSPRTADVPRPLPASAPASETPPASAAPAKTTVAPAAAEAQAPTLAASPAARAMVSPVATTAVPASERARRELGTEPRAEPIRRSEPAQRALDARCSDILQKASLEPLTANEAAYLKRECR